MNNIKAIVLDVDGVIVGDKIGYNSPWPNPLIIERLRKINESGIPISLCSGKPIFSIDKIIRETGLNCMHIADGGSVIINPITNKVIKEYNVDNQKAEAIINLCIENNIYVEFYTIDAYYIDKKQECDITRMHTHILQKEPVKLDNIVNESKNYKITKVMPIALDEKDQIRVQKLIDSLNLDLSYNWGVHPIANPLKFLMVTASSVSKKESVIEIFNDLNIDLANVLAVGDSTSDWKFIGICGYGGAMGNASFKLKELVQSKERGKYFIGMDVDNNGILDILDYFIDIK